MQEVKLNLTINSKGEIILPLMRDLANHTVEVIIIDKSAETPNSSFNAFKNKWAGFLKEEMDDVRDSRIDYLLDKHK